MIYEINFTFPLKQSIEIMTLHFHCATSACRDIPDAEAKLALVDLTAQHCCFGKRTAKEMEISKIEYSSATTVSESHKL